MLNSRLFKLKQTKFFSKAAMAGILTALLLPSSAFAAESLNLHFHYVNAKLWKFSNGAQCSTIALPDGFFNNVFPGNKRTFSYWAQCGNTRLEVSGNILASTETNGYDAPASVKITSTLKLREVVNGTPVTRLTKTYVMDLPTYNGTSISKPVNPQHWVWSSPGAGDFIYTASAVW